MRPRFRDLVGARQVVVADTHRVQTSCGFGVPLMEQRGQRDTLLRWAEAKGPDGIVDYRKRKNGGRIDGLPAPLVSVRHDPERGRSA